MPDIAKEYQYLYEKDLYWNNISIFMDEHWEIPVFCVIFYIAMVVWLPRLMQPVKPFGLKWWLVAWNAFLAIFSMVGTYYTLPPLIKLFNDDGQDGLFCNLEPDAHPWIMLFCLSKIPELVDTLFLILRKKPVIFLHSYHHAVTLLYCWWGWASQTPTGRTFAGMNLFVHSIMYSYYAIMACGIRLPKPLAKSITYMQIFQMVGGMYTCGYGALYCNSHTTAHWYFNFVGCIMYLSYCFLFIQMFFSKYNEVPSDKKKSAKPASNAKSE